MKKSAFTLLSVAFLVLSCTPNNTKNKDVEHDNYVDTTHTSQNSLDWFGIYEGTIPCADCPGIKTKITLTKEGNFQYTAEYLEKNTKIEDSGKIMWHNNGSIIHLKGKEIDTKYKVTEGKLIQLDNNQQEIKGPTTDNYNLIKSN